MKKITSLLLICFVFTSAHAQNITEKLKTAFHKFETDEQLKYASTSFTVLDANNGGLIYGAQENTGLAPASTLKTITSATALALLGENFTFKTDIFYTGNIQNGVLNGDMIIRGSGDPTLGSERWAQTQKAQILTQILAALKAKEIHQIKGKIIGDDGVWDSQSLPLGWIWQDIGNYYGAGSSALCWGENQIELKLKPSNTVGAVVKMADENTNYPFLNILNKLKTGANGSGDQVYAYSAPYTNQIYLRGTYAINLEKKVGLSLPDPALAMAYDVDDFLHKNEIKTNGFTTSRVSNQLDKSDFHPLFSISSPPLKEIIYWFNQKSINIYGEQLLRVLGAKFGKSDAIIDGVKTIQDFWKDKGMATETINISDGSGLAPSDRVTSSTIAKVLLYAQKQNWFKSYLESIPLHNDLKMKSGTIGDVLAYAGYAKIDGQQAVCFSLIVNNYHGSISSIRQKMFTLLNQLK
jgi:D-alanyl-D-alanine carboxypeptidase/D-alanyl-D-alanine-endopeptidase (penicillin-binding protein 4)